MDTRLELGVTRLGPRLFRRQMEALARAGVKTLGSVELEALLATGGEEGRGSLLSPPRASPLTTLSSVVLTFDDAYAALAEHAFPVLADLGLKALVFVITDFAGRENSWDVQYGWRRFRHLSWDDLAHWQERGIEVHSHGVTHARLTWLSDVQAEDELGRSRATLVQRLGGAPPTGFAYPFGAVDARVQALAAAAGYSLGFAGPAGPGGRQPGGPDRLALRRRPVYAWDAFAPPCVLREDAAGAFGMAVARLTSRLAVGTAIIQRLSGARYAARK